MTAGAFLHPFSPPRRTDYLTIVGGEGAVVWDDEGRRYIDGLASLWYMNVGHGRPEMVAAITGQLEMLAAYHCFEPFSNPTAEAAAAKIAELAPMDAVRVFFADSGSEAVDSAMKLARIAHRELGEPERQIIVSRERGYHGVNYGGTSAQGIAVNRDGFGPLVGGVVNVPAGNVEHIAQVFDEHAGRIAAVITEPVQGASGVFPPPEGYLESLRRLCDQEGAFLIFDEVITGFGRMGHWFGADFFGVGPDMITFAKGVTSGYFPLGGVIVGARVRAGLEQNEGFVLKHGYTYSGHPTASAAALAAIGITQRDGLLAAATRIAGQLETGLESLVADGVIREARGAGAMWAARLHEGKSAEAVRDEMLTKGVIVRPLGDALAICPPLVTDDEQVAKILDVLATSA